ncbi:MAG: hypothetical protein P4N60_04615 [Verrucomicrobiae bacterium]|nr:hypothetical protein [Verrucomicrobiae bacterium]
MNWLLDGSCFFAGAFLTNGIPHFVSGVMGRPFQTPFAKPSGKGLSSSTTNVVWGFCNFVVGYVLAFTAGNFNLQATDKVVAFGMGVLVIGVFSARVFGRFHGGNSAGKP